MELTCISLSDISNRCFSLSQAALLLLLLLAVVFAGIRECSVIFACSVSVAVLKRARLPRHVAAILRMHIECHQSFTRALVAHRLASLCPSRSIHLSFACALARIPFQRTGVRVCAYFFHTIVVNYCVAVIPRQVRLGAVRCTSTNRSNFHTFRPASIG